MWVMDRESGVLGRAFQLRGMWTMPLRGYAMTSHVAGTWVVDVDGCAAFRGAPEAFDQAFLPVFDQPVVEAVA